MRFAATSIDLSTLPRPQIIDTFSYEAILAGMKVKAIARAAAAGITLDTLTLETELIAVVLEVAAEEVMLLRQHVNDDALALLLAFAVGPDLEQIAARFGVVRMPKFGVASPRLPVAAFPDDWESDDRLRRRTQLAPNAYSNAGTLRGYEYHALSAGKDDEIVDANCFSPAPGRIDIVLLGLNGAPSDTAMDAVYKRVTARDVKPLTDDTRIYKAKMLDYDVDAVLRIPGGPDPSAVKAAALTSLRAFLKQTNKVGAKVYRSGLIGSLQVPNVYEVVMASPVENLDPGDYGAPRASLSIKTEVVDG